MFSWWTVDFTATTVASKKIRENLMIKPENRNKLRHLKTSMWSSETSVIIK